MLAEPTFLKVTHSRRIDEAGYVTYDFVASISPCRRVRSSSEEPSFFWLVLSDTRDHPPLKPVSSFPLTVRPMSSAVIPLCRSRPVVRSIQLLVKKRPPSRTRMRWTLALVSFHTWFEEELDV